MKHTWHVLAGLGLLVAVGSATARPAHKKELADYFGPFLPRHLNDCRTCHLPDGHVTPTVPGVAEEKPHNAFGARLKAVRNELRSAGKKVDIISRLEAIAEQDSDGDGVSNVLELLSGRNPGEASDKPTPAELERARKLLATFKSRKPYPWKPFEAVQRPAVPQVKNAGWVRSPLDAFVAEQHELHDLKPRPEAPRHVLLRRVYLDLIGLPPTRAELEAFTNDTSPDAYEKVVERLLDSPRHGERWGRHWMDVWRYVDFGNSGLQDGWTGVPNMWRWRDWIVRSLNADKGYDRMVQEMLAADELAPFDTDCLAATCYLARNKGNNRDAWIHDSINHTARAFLGITLECSRCHNHPYDPIQQEEYYQVRALFEPHGIRTDPTRDADPKRGGGLTRVFDSNLNPRTYFYIRGVEQNPDKDRVINPGVPAFLGADNFSVSPVTIPLFATMPHRQPAALAQARADSAREVTEAKLTLDMLAKAAGPLADAERATARVRVQLAESRQAALEAILKVEALEDRDAEKTDRPAWEQSAQAADVAQRQVLLADAQHKRELAQVEVLRLEAALKDATPAEETKARQKLDQAKKAGADADKALARAEQQAQQPASVRYQKRGNTALPRNSTGRRLALARWITNRANPLAARVAVNHIWLRHMGNAIVSSVFDFGAGGQAPSHPALLDWLAAELMEPSTPPALPPVAAKQWSMKRIHRLIVTSSTYRMSSTTDPVNAQADPDNQFYWRMPSRRMEAEIVRDAILHVAGNLELTMFGPEIESKLGLQIRRRSLYFRYTDSDYLRVMEFFDAPSCDDCYRRPETIVPQQALTLLNSDLALTQARLLARGLAEKAPEPAEFVKVAFAAVLARPATVAELETCVKYLAEQTRFLEANKARLSGGANDDGTKGSTVPALRARENLVHLLLNHHDFVTVR